jgi:NAD+ synthase
MTDHLTFAVAQLNPTLGDIAGNIAKLRQARAEAAAFGADLVVGTELCVSGYPPEDLVLKPAFLEACEAAVREFATETATGPAIVIGVPWRHE